MVTEILSRPCGLIFSNRQYFVGEMRQHQMNLLHIANVTIIMSIVSIMFMLLFGSPIFEGLPAVYTPLLILVVCLAYSPLDFYGKIMLGEVGNHTFGVALGSAFYLIGGLWSVIVFGF